MDCLIEMGRSSKAMDELLKCILPARGITSTKVFEVLNSISVLNLIAH